MLCLESLMNPAHNALMAADKTTDTTTDTAAFLLDRS